jgi:hypothetical protein
VFLDSFRRNRSGLDDRICTQIQFLSEIVEELCFIRKDLYLEVIKRLSREHLRSFLVVID